MLDKDEETYKSCKWKIGFDYATTRFGNEDFYGKGKHLDSSKPMKPVDKHWKKLCGGDGSADDRTLTFRNSVAGCVVQLCRCQDKTGQQLFGKMAIQHMFTMALALWDGKGVDMYIGDLKDCNAWSFLLMPDQQKKLADITCQVTRHAISRSATMVMAAPEVATATTTPVRPSLKRLASNADEFSGTKLSKPKVEEVLESNLLNMLKSG